ncbi:MAG: thioredoxin [Bacteroidales bacterium]|nr:thioredoxin [Bacteroidales bacterium]
MNSSPSEKLVLLNDKNFKAKTSKGVVLVDFWAEWCQPCKILGPVISEIAEEMSERATVAKLDVESNQQTAQQLGIRNIPTVIIFKDGKAVAKLIGVKPKKAYIKEIEAALNS